MDAVLFVDKSVMQSIIGMLIYLILIKYQGLPLMVSVRNIIVRGLAGVMIG